MTEQRVPVPRVTTLLLSSLCALCLLSGCWWQRDAYSTNMRREMANFERNAEFDRLLGEPFQASSEFPLWVRPPKATTLRALPQELESVFLGLFQGNEGGGALIELIIMGSTGGETFSEFEQKAFAAMNTAGKGPGTDLKKQDPATVPCMHGGQNEFEVFSGGGSRQLPGAPAPTNYQWVYYFTEDATQKVMLAFVVPDDNYAAFSNAMVKCLESLAIGSKYSAAASGVPASPAGQPASAGGGGAGGGGAANF